VRACLIYDRLYPIRIGGVERWMRDLALRLAERGHSVTYLTERQWRTGEEPRSAGVEIVGLGSYRGDDPQGRRPLQPPFRFGLTVFRHLWRNGPRYDVVHAASFPFFPLLAAATLRRRCGYRLVVDWHEVWTRTYWRSYAGPVVGWAGWLVQRTCIRATEHALCDSRLHADRLRAQGFRGSVSLLRGLYGGPVTPGPAGTADPVVVYAGRLAPHKRVPLLVHAFALLRESHPELRLDLYGDGPDRERVARLVDELGLAGHVQIRGRRSEDEVANALSRAVCLATASEREGYGLVAVEASARGTPSVVVAGPENAATELVTDGVNGAVSPTSQPSDLAEAIARVAEAGDSLRVSTKQWFDANTANLLVEGSLAVVLDAYGAPRGSEDATAV
jgi:glycosyltransferase involved in cell wall biosynthesis